MILKIGCPESDSVWWLQRDLNFLGFPCGLIDSDFGEKTDGAVRTYQEVRRLSVDGEVRAEEDGTGGETWTSLLSEVQWVQGGLAKLGFEPGSIDGLAGDRTVAATEAFQTKYGLVVDGIAGTHTRGELENPTVPLPVTEIPHREPSAGRVIAIIPRAVWGARPPKQDNPQSGKDAEIVHHTITTAPGGDELAEIRAIQNAHMDGRGWNDIGYNLLVGRTGDIYEGREGGLAAVGAHASGFNTRSIGVACLGDYQTGTPTPETHAALDNLTAWLKGQTVAMIEGHRDVNATACPGDNLYSAFKR
ncbi:MAG: peptidoglycan-binding protein [Actinobacteria bacterium]|nr:peptidoglycan-binding protein [Actinomycetota bacterium]